MLHGINELPDAPCRDCGALCDAQHPVCPDCHATRARESAYAAAWRAADCRLVESVAALISYALRVGPVVTIREVA